MKALVFHKLKDVSVDTVDDLKIEKPPDALFASHLHTVVWNCFKSHAG